MRISAIAVDLPDEPAEEVVGRRVDVRWGAQEMVGRGLTD
jgi:hypothetical protein